MFKYDDTEIFSDLERPSGTYILAHSEDCAEAYNKGYNVRYYEGEDEVSPWNDEADRNIDFGDITEALAQLSVFPEEDHESLREWLTEQVDLGLPTPEEREQILKIKQERSRAMFKAMQAAGEQCRLVDDDTGVEVELEPGHFMTWTSDVVLKRRRGLQN